MTRKDVEFTAGSSAIFPGESMVVRPRLMAALDLSQIYGINVAFATDSRTRSEERGSIPKRDKKGEDKHLLVA
jgi:hypothetical protein